MLLLRLLFILAILYILFLVLKANLDAAVLHSQTCDDRTAKRWFWIRSVKPMCRESDAVLQAGKYFCSEECAQLYLTH